MHLDGEAFIGQLHLISTPGLVSVDITSIQPTGTQSDAQAIVYQGHYPVAPFVGKQVGGAMRSGRTKSLYDAS